MMVFLEVSAMKCLRVWAVASMVLFAPVAAHANIWDWIQELSGPGPLHGRGNVLTTLCPGALRGPFNKEHPATVESIPPDGAFDKRPCFFADLRRLQNHRDEKDLDRDNFPAAVNLTAYDFGVTWQFGPGRPLELGTGVGLAVFRGRPDGASIMTTTPRFTVTPVRGVVTPLALVPAWQRNRFARILKFHAGWILIPGTIDATDFGVPLGTGPGQSLFSEPNDWVFSKGFLIDLGELIRH